MKLLKVNETAKKLNISRGKIYKMIKNGQIPYIEIGGCIRIPEDKIDVPANSTLADKQRVIKESIVMKDIHDVLGCVEFFVKIDPDVFKGAGTVSEITFAAYFNKRITYMLDDVKFQDIPNWVQGCLYGAMRVKNISDAIKYYKKLKL